MCTLQTDVLVGEVQCSEHPENDPYLKPYSSTFYFTALLGTPGP